MPFKNYCVPGTILGFPVGTSGKESTCQCRRHETEVRSLGLEDSPEEGMEPTPVFLPGESRGQKSLVGYSPEHHTKWHMTEAT